MADYIEQFFIIAYSLNAVIASIGYLPQIRKLFLDKTKSENFSIPTWALWTWTTLMTFSYASVVNGDLIFIVVSGTYFIGTITIFGLVLYNRFYKDNNI